MRFVKTQRLISTLAVSLLGMPTGALFLTLAASPAQAETAAKTVEGKVLDGGSTPLPGSIVYLQDQKTSVVKTFIATGDGSYRFGQLPADTDYKLWAENAGVKSKIRLISSFDTKLKLDLDLHIGK